MWGRRLVTREWQRAGKVKVKVTQSCLTLCQTLCDTVDYTIHGILQARILERVAFPFTRGASQPKDRTQVSRIAGRFFTSWATREAQEYWSGEVISGTWWFAFVCFGLFCLFSDFNTTGQKLQESGNRCYRWNFCLEVSDWIRWILKWFSTVRIWLVTGGMIIKVHYLIVMMSGQIGFGFWFYDLLSDLHQTTSLL